MSLFLVFSEAYFGGLDHCRKIFDTLDKATIHAKWVSEHEGGNGMILIQELNLNGNSSDKLIYYEEDDSNQWVKQGVIYRHFFCFMI